MKRRYCLAPTLFLVLLFFSMTALAQEEAVKAPRNYLSAKIGAYIPTSDLDEFDNGYYLDLMYNWYLSRYAALETGFSFYGTEATASGTSPILGSYTETDTVVVMPLKANIKGILPFPWGELYIGGGVGLYFASVEAMVTSTGLGAFYFTERDTVPGAQVKTGANFNIAESFFMGVEGEYMVTETADFSGQAFGMPITIESDLNGYTLSVVFGFRF